MSAIKVGDRVRWHAPRHPNHGWEGTVTELDHNLGYEAVVQFPDKPEEMTTWPMSLDELVLLPPEKK